MPFDPAESFRVATRLHLAGELVAAADAYRQLLRNSPSHADALHQLGVLAAQRREFDLAVTYLEQAVAIEPTRGAFQVNLANALKDAGRLADAVPRYLRSIEILSEESLPLINLGNTYQLLGQRSAAIDAYRRALTFQLPPETEATVRCNLGLCLALTRRANEALAELNASLRLQPENPESLQHIGMLMVQQGSLATGLKACDASLEGAPNVASTHNVRGLALAKLQRPEEAEAAYRRAIELAPRFAQYRVNLANVLIQQQRLYDAVAMAEEAALVDPAFGGSRQVLGGLYLDLARHTESAAAFDRAVELDPNEPGPLGGKVFAEQFYPGFSAQTQAVTRRLFDERFGSRGPGVRHDNDRSPDRPLRVGFISPNYTNHVVALTMVPLFANLDPAAFEVWLYSDVACPIPHTDRFASLATRFQPVVGLTDDQVAERVREDRIDILVDLTMHMTENRLGVFIRRPAPVQVTWLAYPGSTGLSAIDYRISDPHLDPPGLFDALYSERTVRLPDTFWCYHPMLDLPPAAPPPQRAAGRVTFGCLNNFCKVNDGVLQLWARVLTAVPGSRLMLLSPHGKHRAWVENSLAAAGVTPDRVEHVDRRSRREYMRVYDRIDICLDTLPYNGHTTSLDAYYMGVPVVSRIGDTLVGRAGLSQLTNLGLTELVAHDDDGFVRVATQLAAQPDRLAELRSSMRDRMQASPLMDGPRFARGMEAAFRQMWRDWCASATT